MQPLKEEAREGVKDEVNVSHGLGWNDSGAERERGMGRWQDGFRDARVLDT
jgi:hypothetical protein